MFWIDNFVYNFMWSKSIHFNQGWCIKIFWEVRIVEIILFSKTVYRWMHFFGNILQSEKYEANRCIHASCMCIYKACYTLSTASKSSCIVVSTRDPRCMRHCVMKSNMVSFHSSHNLITRSPTASCSIYRVFQIHL